MKNYYELFEKCIQSSGTKASYCSRALNDIIPSEKYTIKNINGIDSLNIKSIFNSKINNDEFSDWKIINKYEPFTNDDASNYLKSLLKILKNADYLKNYSITVSDTNDSLVAIMETFDRDKKLELYEMFDDLPKSFNSRVLAYLS